MIKTLQILRVATLGYLLYVIYRWSNMLVIRYNTMPILLKEIMYFVIAITIIESIKIFIKDRR
jgi:hypothetical protein